MEEKIEQGDIVTGGETKEEIPTETKEETKEEIPTETKEEIPTETKEEIPTETKEEIPTETKEAVTETKEEIPIIPTPVETKTAETRTAETKEDISMNPTKAEETKKTALGIDENIEGVLCYIIGFLTGILFLVLEKDNKFVRFHAMQSIATFLPLFVISFIVWMVPLLGWILGMLLWLVSLGLWIFLMYKAYSGEKYKVPIAGDFAEEQIR